MPVESLIDEQAAVYGRYIGPVPRAGLDRYAEEVNLAQVWERVVPRGELASALRILEEIPPAPNSADDEQWHPAGQPLRQRAGVPADAVRGH